MAVVTNPTIDSKTRGIIMKIVEQIKSEGVFDRFRRECLEELDSKEPYRQLKQRVESHVAAFLSKQIHSPNLPKNQLRNSLRTNISQSEVLSKGVDRLLEEVLSEKSSSFYTEINDLVHDHLTSIGHYGKRDKEKGQKLENQKVEKEKQQKMEISKLDREIDEFIKQETNKIIEANSGDKSKEPEASVFCDATGSGSGSGLFLEGKDVAQDSVDTKVCEKTGIVDESRSQDHVSEDATRPNTVHTVISEANGVSREGTTVVLDDNEIQASKDTSISMDTEKSPKTPETDTGSTYLEPDSVQPDLIQPTAPEFAESSQIASDDTLVSMGEVEQLDVSVQENTENDGNEISKSQVLERSEISSPGASAHAQSNTEIDAGIQVEQQKGTSSDNNTSDDQQPSTSKVDNQNNSPEKIEAIKITRDAIPVSDSLPTSASEMPSKENETDSEQIPTELNIGSLMEYTQLSEKPDPAYTGVVKSCNPNEERTSMENQQQETESIRHSPVDVTSISRLSPENAGDVVPVERMDIELPTEKDHNLVTTEQNKSSSEKGIEPASEKIKADESMDSRPAKKIEIVSNESLNQAPQKKTVLSGEAKPDTKYTGISERAKQVLPNETKTVTAVTESKKASSSEKAKPVSGKDGKAVVVTKETKLIITKEGKQGSSSEKAKLVSGKHGKAVVLTKETKLDITKDGKQASSSEKTKPVLGKDGKAVVLTKENKLVISKERKPTSLSEKLKPVSVLPKETKPVITKGCKQASSSEKAKPVSGKDSKPAILPEEAKLVITKEMSLKQASSSEKVKPVSGKQDNVFVPKHKPPKHSKETKNIAEVGERKVSGKESEAKESSKHVRNKEKIRNADSKAKRLANNDVSSVGETVEKKSVEVDDPELSDSDITVSSVHTSDLSSLEDSDMEYEDYKAMRLKEKQAKSGREITATGSKRAPGDDNGLSDFGEGKEDENDANDMSGSDFAQRRPSDSIKKAAVLSSSEATTWQTDTDSDVLPQRRSSRVASAKIAEDDSSQRTTPENTTGDESVGKNSRRKRSANETSERSDSETQKITSDSTECENDGRRQSKRSRRKIRPTRCYSPSENF